MDTAASNPGRLILRCRDERLGAVLQDDTAWELLRHLAALRPTSPPSLPALARRDPSFAAWLVDRITGGVRTHFKSLGTNPTNGLEKRLDGHIPAIRWQGLEDVVCRIPAGELLRCLAKSLDLGKIDEELVADWLPAQRRTSEIAQRAAELARARSPDQAEDVYWWSSYLTAPLVIQDPGAACWVRNPLDVDALAVGGDHPLALCLSCLREALADAGEHRAGCPSPIAQDAGPGIASLRSLIPALFRLTDRCTRLENDFQGALEAEKLLAMKELAYGASHEINNPLANISSRAQMLLRDEVDPERRRWLATMNSQAFRAHEMIADMMLFAKPPGLQLTTIRIGELVAEIVERLAAELPTEVHMESDLQLGDWQTRADPVQLTVAIRAIWSNALEAMGNRGRLRLSGRIIEASPLADCPAWARIEIADSGPGIPPQVRRHLFDPFFSGREAGRGLGFGLSKAWRIVQLHRGRIEVSSEPGEGAVLTVCLPMVVPGDDHGSDRPTA